MITNWRGGSDQTVVSDLKWQPLGEWIEERDSLAVASGSNSKGEAIAIRISGRIRETDRKMYSEIGWLDDADPPSGIPLISPVVWQEAWLSHVRGEINETKMVEKLLGRADGLASGRVSFRFQQLPKDKPYMQRIALVAGALIFGAALGFGFGRIAFETQSLPENIPPVDIPISPPENAPYTQKIPSDEATIKTPEPESENLPIQEGLDTPSDENSSPPKKYKFKLRSPTGR